jgi:hypothetical protein
MQVRLFVMLLVLTVCSMPSFSNALQLIVELHGF